jgi:hypothetical protein
MKASKLVKSVLVGTGTFLAGCGGPAYTVYEERAYNDGVPVVYHAMPNYHYSAFYGGYVPLIVPIGGFYGGANYTTVYNRLPASQRRTYATPVSSTNRPAPRASVTAKPSTGSNTARPTPSGAVAKPSAGKASPAPSSNVSRGIAGGTGSGSAAS